MAGRYPSRECSFARLPIAIVVHHHDHVYHRAPSKAQHYRSLQQQVLLEVSDARCNASRAFSTVQRKQRAHTGNHFATQIPIWRPPGKHASSSSSTLPFVMPNQGTVDRETSRTNNVLNDDAKDTGRCRVPSGAGAHPPSNDTPKLLCNFLAHGEHHEQLQRTPPSRDVH